MDKQAAPQPIIPDFSDQLFPEEKEENLQPLDSNPNEEQKREEVPMPEPKPIEKVNIDAVKDTILSKVEIIRKNYNFAMNYSLCVINILKYFNELLCERLFTSLHESKHLIKIFKDLSSLYQSFSDQIKKQVSHLKEQSDVPKIMDDSLKQMVENTQNTLCNNFQGLSNSLKQRLITDGLISQMDNFYSQLENIKKEIQKHITKIENRRKKLEKLYKTKYETLFEDLIPSDTTKALSPEQQRIFMLEDISDFIIIEIELHSKINKMCDKTKTFLTDLKVLATNMNELFVKYTKILRDALIIYIQECKKLYTKETTSVFQQAEIYCEGLSKPDIDQSFQIQKIFTLPVENTNINKLLQEYLKILIELDVKKEKADLLTEHKFEIQAYTNVESFYEFLINVNPDGNVIIEYNNLLLAQFKIQRDPGVFQSWKHSIMFFTKQNHVIVYDEPVGYKTFVSSFDLSKVQYKNKPEKKNPNLFEVIPQKTKGKINLGRSCVYDANTKEGLLDIMERFIEYKKWFTQPFEQREVPVKDEQQEKGESSAKKKVLSFFKKKDK